MMRPPPVLLGVLAAACGGGSPDLADERPPDVILVVVDTLRADRLGCYGYERATTPEIDRLAREGVLFEDACAQSSWTKPSMVSMFQGRYLTDYRDAFLEDAPTLAEVLRGAGYRTLGVVGNVLLSQRAGFDRGFDHYDAKRHGPRRRGRPGRAVDELIVDAWGPLEGAFAGEGRPPVFAYLHVMDPHEPYRSHPQLEGVLPLREGTERSAFERQRARFAGAGSDLSPAEEERIWRQMADKRARYDQEVRYTDEHLALLLERLRSIGALERALVVIASDHGEGLWDHVNPEKAGSPELRPDTYFLKNHGQLVYEELLRTPLIFHGWGIPGGVRVAAPVENVDLLPTLLELCGVEVPAGLHGHSLVPLMHDPQGTLHEEVHAYVMQEASVREVTSGLKLVLPGPLYERPARLFDLGADPGERRDLAPQRPDDVARLRQRLEAWRARYPTPTTIDVPLDAQTRRDMRALGYGGVLEDRPSGSEGSGTDADR